MVKMCSMDPSAEVNCKLTGLRFCGVFSSIFQTDFGTSRTISKSVELSCYTIGVRT